MKRGNSDSQDLGDEGGVFWSRGSELNDRLVRQTTTTTTNNEKAHSSADLKGEREAVFDLLLNLSTSNATTYTVYSEDARPDSPYSLYFLSS